MGEETLVDDYRLIAPITLPSNGQAPGEVKPISETDEYDAYFRIEHEDDMSQGEWVHTVLTIAEKVRADLPATSLEDGEQAQILDGIAIILQHTLQQMAS
ncbi:hypothetical protein ACH4UR_33865 [Streptomyces lydicus]|uniref:hypothetical protein n=1 Tax=Streptomyces lydicus TaxID=47763 RepID=UPI003405DD13